MQPLKITLPGQYWDSHIYSGKLYLFDREGHIDIVDWDSLIDKSISLPEPLHLPMQCAFQRSDYLYSPDHELMFADAEISEFLAGKFERLSRALEQDGLVDWRSALLRRQDNPFPFPHADARIYSKTMYVVSDDGLMVADLSRGRRRAISSQAVREWDCPLLSIAVSHGRLALAAGDDGLFEKQVARFGPHGSSEAIHEDAKLIEARPCTSCEWVFANIFGSSHEHGGFLALFDHRDGVDRFEEREYRKTTRASEIFDAEGYAWANRDKIYQVGAECLRVVRFNGKDEPDRYTRLEDIAMSGLSGTVVSGGVACFGTIIEMDGQLTIALSDDTIHSIPGEPVRWRIFPRSRHYENQLHAIYADRLEIWSFNQDYFVNQREKLAGFEYVDWRRHTRSYPTSRQRSIA